MTGRSPNCLSVFCGTGMLYLIQATLRENGGAEGGKQEEQAEKEIS